MASDAVTGSYKRMCNGLDEYLGAIREDMFRYAYQCGYEAAVAAFGKGGVA